MAREQRNFQFDFLRPQHSLFQYFTKLLEQYTKVLMPPKDLMRKLKEESYDRQNILENVKYRSEWQKHQDALRRKEEQLIEKERCKTLLKYYRLLLCFKMYLFFSGLCSD